MPERRVKKELEDDHRAAEGTVYGPGIADRLNVETYDENLNQKVTLNFSPEMGVWCSHRTLGTA